DGPLASVAVDDLATPRSGYGTGVPVTLSPTRRRPEAEGLLRHGKAEGGSQNRTAHHHEERQAGPAGDLPDLRQQGLQDRRLTARPHPTNVDDPRRGAGGGPRPA